MSAHTATLPLFVFPTLTVFGGFLTWRRSRLFWAHPFDTTDALGLVTIGRPCFLTDIGNWARVATGRVVMENGFIDHHLTGNLYPPEHLLASRVVIAGVVVAPHVGLAVLLWGRGHVQ